MSVRPLVDRQYLGQLAVVREPTGSVGRHRSVTLDGDSDHQYLADPRARQLVGVAKSATGFTERLDTPTSKRATLWRR
jgi:hypothetical protein